MICINSKWKHTQTIIAGVSDVPVQIAGGVRIDWHDLLSTHELDADILIISSVNAKVAMLPNDHVIISPVPSNGRYPCHHTSTH